MGYDTEREQFLVQWSGTGKQKHVSRLNLRFDDENQHQFAMRLQAAHSARLVSEARVVRNKKQYFLIHRVSPEAFEWT